jgi:ABC-type branched-subunit amino acid transport system ATPase component
VEENLHTGFAPLKRRDRSVPDTVFSLFPVLRSMLGGAAATSPAASSNSSRSAAPW